MGIKMLITFTAVCCVLIKAVQSARDYSRNGDIIVAALLSISKSDLCKEEDPKGVLRAEAVIHSLSKHTSQQRNYTLGYKIKDTCGDPRIAVEATYHLVTRHGEANSSHSPKHGKIAAVIVDGSNSTIQASVKGILDAYRIPQIVIGQQDFMETAELKDTTKVLSDLLKVLEYAWVALLGSTVDGSPTSRLKFELESQSTCVVDSATKYGETTSDRNLGQPGNDWDNFGQGRLHIIMSNTENTMDIIDKATNKTWLIITDSPLTHGNHRETLHRGSIFLLSKESQEHSHKVNEFQHYLKKLNENEIKDRPWQIKTLLEKLKPDCYPRIHDCSNKSRPSPEFLKWLQQVEDILRKVSQLHLALDEILCIESPSSDTKCQLKSKEVESLRTKLNSYFQRVCHDGHSCKNRSSVSQPEGDQKSYVLRKAHWNMSDKTGMFPRIGEWGNNSGWTINPGDLRTLKNSKKDWECPNGYPVKLPSYWDHCQQTACLICSINDKPWEKKWTNDSCRLCTVEKCSNVPLIYLKLTHPFALTITCLCVFGELLVIFVVVIFAKFRKTPVVKSSNRVLNFFMLSTIGFWFAIIPSFLDRPTYLRCNVIVAVFLMLYATVSAILLSKTVRLLLIFKSMQQGTKWLGNISCFLTTIAFILIQGLLCGLSYAFYPLDVRTLFRYDTVSLYCERTPSPITALGFAYNCLLSGLCGFFAYKVRKLPQNFNEAKYISFAIFSYSVSWMIVLTGYYDENCSSRQIAVVCLGLAIGAFSVLACLFFPKVYTILFYPQLNTKSVTLEGARRYSVEASVSMGGIRTNRGRSSTLEIQYPSKSCTDISLFRDNQLVVPQGRPRTISDCSFSQLMAQRCRHCSACSTDTGSSDTPRSGTISVPVSGPTSPV